MKILTNISKYFLQFQVSAGKALIMASALALWCANSDFNSHYQNFLLIKLPINLGFLNIHKNMDVKMWIDDGLMSLFFLLVGLELKRELMVGELSAKSRIFLPFYSALAGVTLPAIIYMGINLHRPSNWPGIAIPTATDIVFALAILTFFGDKISNSLKIFLLALAVIDDFIAILIIAIFYSSNIDYSYISYGLLLSLLLLLFNFFKIVSLIPYLVVAPFLWLVILKSGVNPTVFGIVFACFIPTNFANRRAVSPLQSLEKFLHFPVSYIILPLFAFANIGVNLSYLSGEIFSNRVVLGIIMGLFFGKQIGVISIAYLLNKFNICPFLHGVSWSEFYGAAILTGIGFTMSLFIGNLAFADNVELLNQVRIAVFCASALSGIFGFVVLKIGTSKS